MTRRDLLSAAEYYQLDADPYWQRRVAAARAGRAARIATALTIVALLWQAFG